MTFVVVLIALLIERFFDWSHLRYWRGYLTYQNKLQKLMPHLSPYLILLFSAIPWLILVALIHWMIQGWLYGFLKLLFDIIILLYCFGPRNLWADAFLCIQAFTQTDAVFAEEKLKNSFNIIESKNVHQQLLHKIFICPNNLIFAVLIWFTILGPVGAVLYRVIALTSADSLRDKVAPDLSQSAFLVAMILDWIPVRLFTFLFALGGAFVQVFTCFRALKRAWFDFNSNDILLGECGMAALGYHESLPEDGSAETQAINLLDRTFIIALGILAMMAWLI